MVSERKSKPSNDGKPTDAWPKKLSRRPQVNGYACGENTRARIIETAIGLFGKLGLDGATTRGIAGQAQVALPALQYYFCNKIGLYLACAEYIADHMGARMAPVISSVKSRLETGGLKRSEFAPLLYELLDTICDHILGPGVPDGWIPFILREQAFPGPAFEVIRKRTLGQVLHLLTTLLHESAGAGADPTRVRLGVLALLGHVLVFRTARNAAFHLLACKGINEEVLRLIKADVRSHADQVLVSLRD